LGNELEPDESEPLSARLARLGTQIDDLDLTDRVGSGYATEIEELTEVEAELDEVEVMLQEFQAIEPSVLVSPLAVDTAVVGATDVDLAAFYVPGVIALLLQHLAITFASLSLVRERALGAQEIFQVAPVGPGAVLTGKYLGYSVGAMAIAGALSVGMVAAFDVPMTGSVVEFGLTLLLLTLASLGVGFLISSLVSSDVQAVNVTMIVLLLSIFFSGFFLSLDRLIPAVRAVSWLLPITHALEAMRTIMFRGGSVPPPAWMALGVGAAVLFVTSWILLGRRLREA
jgi:ABC-2 type transport system permease protein